MSFNNTLQEPLEDGAWYKISVSILHDKVYAIVESDQLRCSNNPCQLSLSYPSDYNHFASTVFDKILIGTDFASFFNDTSNELDNGMVGCIRNLHISSSSAIDLMSHFNPKYPAEVGCPREEGCHPNPCANEGKCTSNWNSYFCQCTSAFTGQNCTEGM